MAIAEAVAMGDIGFSVKLMSRNPANHIVRTSSSPVSVAAASVAASCG